MTQHVVIHIIDLDKLFTFVNLNQSSEIHVGCQKSLNIN